MSLYRKDKKKLSRTDVAMLCISGSIASNDTEL